MKLATGAYSLEKWRRMFQNPGTTQKKKPGGTGRRRPGKEGEAKKKLSNIVNKILASKSGEDNYGGVLQGSD